MVWREAVVVELVVAELVVVWEGAEVEAEVAEAAFQEHLLLLRDEIAPPAPHGLELPPYAAR